MKKEREREKERGLGYEDLDLHYPRLRSIEDGFNVKCWKREERGGK
jgi:hypothetical protein